MKMLAALLMTCIVLAGCTSVTPKHEPLIQDSKRDWEQFQHVMSTHIEREASGGTPYFEDPMSWPDFWNARLEAIRENTENPEKYVMFIVEKRRQAGLPALDQPD